MTTKYQSNEANQYTRIETGTEIVEPRFDKLGNLLHDDRNTYTWDADIHLLSVETKSELADQKSGVSNQGSGVSNQKSAITRFAYDALHRRVARMEQGSAGAPPAPGGAPPPSIITVFVMDGWNVIAEYREESSAGLQPARRTTEEKAPAVAGAPDHAPRRRTTLAVRHLWGEDLSGTLQGAGGIGGLLASSHHLPPAKNEEPRTTNAFHHYDSNGNVILLTDRTGIPSAKYRYDAFGKTISATGPMAQVNRYQFSTKPIERGSGLVYYGYRYYDSITGRWPSRDPIGESGGINLFVMANNQPVSLIDKIGLSFADCLNNCNQMATNGYVGCVALEAVALTGCGVIAIFNPPLAIATANLSLVLFQDCMLTVTVAWGACLAACWLLEDAPEPDPNILP